MPAARGKRRGGKRRQRADAEPEVILNRNLRPTRRSAEAAARKEEDVEAEDAVDQMDQVKQEDEKEEPIVTRSAKKKRRGKTVGESSETVAPARKKKKKSKKAQVDAEQSVKVEEDQNVDDDNNDDEGGGEKDSDNGTGVRVPEAMEDEPIDEDKSDLKVEQEETKAADETAEKMEIQQDKEGDDDDAPNTETQDSKAADKNLRNIEENGCHTTSESTMVVEKNDSEAESVEPQSKIEPEESNEVFAGNNEERAELLDEEETVQSKCETAGAQSLPNSPVEPQNTQSISILSFPAQETVPESSVAPAINEGTAADVAELTSDNAKIEEAAALDPEKLAAIQAEEAKFFDKLSVFKEIERNTTGVQSGLPSQTRHVSRAEKMLDDLLSLRTTEAEASLESFRKAASDRLAAQSLLIQNLHSELERQKEANAAWTGRERELTETVSELKTKTLAQAKEIADRLAEDPNGSKGQEATQSGGDSGASASSAAVAELRAQIGFYRQVTGLTIRSKGDSAYECTLKNSQKRKLVKFALQADQNAGDVVYTPLANVSYMPEVAKTKLSLPIAQFPVLQAKLQHAIFCDEEQENAPPQVKSADVGAKKPSAITRI
mmetsp:Transcript_10612/g.18784  ORF Transcript_10612/g.18784 Transcript_10612/m.18784 type:complete len:607 (+) Transcript_10612:142-1962(+)